MSSFDYQSGYGAGLSAAACNSDEDLYRAKAKAANARAQAVANELQEAKKNKEGFRAVYKALRDALMSVAPNHPLVAQKERQKIFDEAYYACK